MKNFKTISFSIVINTAKDNVWAVLWSPEYYRQWASVFCEGSYYVGQLKVGATVSFLKQDGDGMLAQVDKCTEKEQMVFTHQRELKDGQEVDSTWLGAKEIYHLKDVNGGTELQVILDTTPEMETFFRKSFPKALAVIKRIAESE